MAGHGGYRAPANPAAVSGPGKLSRRTDGKQPQMPMGNGNYGDTTELAQLQSGAPLAQVSQGGGAPTVRAPTEDPTAALTPLGAPSTQPNTPVTDGAAYGPGAGPAALGLPQSPGDMDRADAQALSKFLPIMLRHAQSANATPGFRAYVRQIIANS